MNDEAELDIRLFRIWLKSYKTVMQKVHKDITSHGLTIDNFMVMELLYHKGPHTIQVLSEKLLIASGSITHVVNRLVEKGLVQREISHENRRFCHVSLTAEGMALFDEIFPKHKEVISESVGILTTEEKQQLAHLLKTVGLGTRQQPLQEEPVK